MACVPCVKCEHKLGSSNSCFQWVCDLSVLYLSLSLLTILQSERKLNLGLTGRVFFISLDSTPLDLYLLANDFLNPK